MARQGMRLLEGGEMISGEIDQPISTPISGASQSIDPTDGRTNEQNGEPSLPPANIPPVNVRAGEKRDGLNPLSEVMGQWIDTIAPGERWPLVRTGDREPIRWAVRRAIGLRDGWGCKLCGVTLADQDHFELDHIVPWSAGGSDRSSNLRLLCQPCNQRRSNYQDGTEKMTVLPVTWWCVFCWRDGMDFDGHRFGVHCRAKETCAHQAGAFGAVPRIRFDDADQYAFCAHCRVASWTEITL